MNNGKVTASIFLDLTKTFDTVDQNILINYIHMVSLLALNWFKSYLYIRIQTISINSTMSVFKDIDIGIPQGSILGQLLFIIYVNSLPDSVTYNNV